MRKNWQKEKQKYLRDRKMNIEYSGSGVGQKHIYIADKYKAKYQSSTVHLIVGANYKVSAEFIALLKI